MKTNDNDIDGERLWLSTERGAMGSYHRLSLLGGGRHDNIGMIYPLAGGGWVWTISLDTRDGRKVAEKGDAASAEEASELQFDALARNEPERFMRLAA